MITGLLLRVSAECNKLIQWETPHLKCIYVTCIYDWGDIVVVAVVAIVVVVVVVAVVVVAAAAAVVAVNT